MACLAMAVASIEPSSCLRSLDQRQMRAVCTSLGPLVKNCSVRSAVGMRKWRRMIRAAASPGKDDEEETEQEQEQEQEQDEAEEVKGEKRYEIDEAGRDHLRDLIKRKVRKHYPGITNYEPPIEETFFSTYDKLMPFLENEKPSEGMKQLLALVEADPVFKEPIYRERYPRYLMDIAGFAFIFALYTVIRRVNDYLEARAQRRANEMRAALAEWMKKNENTRLVRFLKRVKEFRSMGFQNFQAWLQSLLLLLQAKLIELFNQIKGRFT